MGQANPAMDGWFFSDFFLFHHLLQGLGISQQWCSAEEPQQLIQKYGEYLHGNPHKPRKVVLNQNMVKAGKLDNFLVFPRGQPINKVLLGSSRLIISLSLSYFLALEERQLSKKSRLSVVVRIPPPIRAVYMYGQLLCLFSH